MVQASHTCKKPNHGALSDKSDPLLHLLATALCIASLVSEIFSYDELGNLNLERGVVNLHMHKMNSKFPELWQEVPNTSPSRDL